MVDEIELQVKLQCDRAPVRVEGLRDGTWVLMDYGDFLVHVFWKRHAPTTNSSTCGPQPHASIGARDLCC